jgi:hypothetical protein
VPYRRLFILFKVILIGYSFCCILRYADIFFGGVSLKLMERDYIILNMIYRFGFCFGRHVAFLANFPSARTCDRRLKLLVDNGYLFRKKVLYGLPYLYYLTKDGMRLIHVTPRNETIRVDKIHHDMTVLDCLPYFIKHYGFTFDTMTTERELHCKDGFGVRQHHPDIVFQKDGESYAIEFELSKKATVRLIHNIEQNYLNYDVQIWVIPASQSSTWNILTSSLEKYDSIEVMTLESLLS